MFPPRRTKCCGFNVAKNCVGGPALFFGIPLLVTVHMKTVVLTSFFVEQRNGSHLLTEVLLEWLVCILTECCLFLLLVADPGFIEEPTELSCRCANCKMEVEDFDHHCGVLGVCIGRGNMCYFIFFLLFASLLCIIGGVENAVYVVLFISARRVGEATQSWGSFTAIKSAIAAWLKCYRHVCVLVLSAVAIYGGAVSTFLCLRYTHLSYQGRSSVRRRRRASLRGSLSLVFANVFQPKFSHNYSFSAVSGREEMRDETR